MAFVVSQGQLAALGPQYDRLSWKHTATNLSDHLTLTYEQIWKTQPAVRQITGFLARNMASVALGLMQRVDDKLSVPLYDHPLAQVLNDPYPGSNWTQYRLVNSLMLDLCIYDDAYWMLIAPTPEAKNGAILHVPSRFVRPHRGSTGGKWWEEDGYVVSIGGQQFPVPFEGMAHFNGYNPSGELTGVSPMESLRNILAEEYAATAYRSQLWRNGARTSGYLSRPVEAKDWDRTDRERFRRAWQQMYAADGPGAGGVPVLEDGMTWMPAGVTPKDAQYVESRALTRAEVAAAYWVPPAIAGLESQNTTPVQDQHVLLYQDTLGPWAEQISQDIRQQVLPRLDPAGAVSGKLYVWFNFDSKRRGDFAQEVTANVAAGGAPWMTRAELRARAGLPKLSDPDEQAEAEKLITPMNVSVGGLANPQDTAPNNPSNEASNGQPETKPAKPQQQSQDNAGKARFARGARRAKMHVPQSRHVQRVLSNALESQLRAVAGKLGKARGQKALPSLDDLWAKAKWDAELADEFYVAAEKVTTSSAGVLLAHLGYSADSYDVARTEAWLKAHAANVASAFNDNTASEISAARTAASGDLEAFAASVKERFANWLDVDGRADQTSDAETRSLSGWASDEAVDQVSAKGATKSWVTGGNPRQAHASMNGETINFGELFSNGARWPGDSADPDGYGCNCDLEYGVA